MQIKIHTCLHFLLKLALVSGVLLIGSQKIMAFSDFTAARPVHAQIAPDPTTPTDSGGGEYRLQDAPDLSDAQRQEIQNTIDANIQRMGLQTLNGISPLNTSLSWPVRGASGLTDYAYSAVSGFVDHNPGYPNQLQDYTCGTRTYDTSSGYNHAGTDIFSWPFGWYKMDNNQVEVIAAAPGTIISKLNGNPSDRSCAMNNNTWNAVFIRHADGSVAWYGHLKYNSLTTKPVGASVDTGEYLGIVGSSGSSTGPHLHFELHDPAGNVVDPYAGACNNITSLWAAQRPYYDSAINSVMTGSAKPVFPTCPTTETTNAKDQFLPGDTVYFTTFYRDQLAGQLSQYTVYRPDGTVFQSWTTSSAAPYYSAAYWYRSYTLADNAPPGLWRFEVVYNGQTYQHSFSVGNSLYLFAQPHNRSIQLNWSLYGSQALTSWQITYTGPAGDQASPITVLEPSARSYTLTGLTNYAPYSITLTLLGTLPLRTAATNSMPTDIFTYLPAITK